MQNESNYALRDLVNKLVVPLPRTNYMKNSFSYSGAVTVIWVSPCFGYLSTQIPSVLGTQNTESIKLG